MIWSAEDADAGNIVRVITGMGVGGVMAAAFFWLIIKQSEKHIKEKEVMREERREDIARLERRIDQLYTRLGIPPDKEVQDDGRT